MWVLVVFFLVGTGGYNQGKAVNFQEFSSKERCEAAIKLIDDKTTRTVSQWPASDTIIRHFSCYCIEK